MTSQQTSSSVPIKTTTIASPTGNSSGPTQPTTSAVEAAPLAQTTSAHPSISLTPATPDTAQSTTLPPAFSPNSTTAETVPAQTQMGSTTQTTEKPSSAAPVAAASSSKPTPSTTTAPTTKPAASTSAPAGQKKKRRRKGFAGFLLALGCLSASEFEDDPKEARKRDATAGKAAAGSSKSDVKATSPASEAAQTKEKPAVVKEGRSSIERNNAGTKVGSGSAVSTGAAVGTGAAVAAGTGAVLANDQKQADEVVAPPSEPVSPPLDETAGMTSSAVQPPGSGSELLQTTPSRPSIARKESEAGTPSADKTSSSGGYTEMLQTEGTSSQDQAEQHGEEGEEEYAVEEEYEDEEDRLIAQGGIGIPLDEHGRPAPLLPPISPEHTGRKCLVLDLDETLLHSSFKMLPSADYIVPVEIESQTHNVYVIKRPGVDHFLTEMGKIYEVVVFTASLSKYADPVLDMLDPNGVVKHRLFRESCYNHKGNYVKDLSQLGRAMETCIILDNSPASYIFHPNNAVPVSTWFNDPHDTELTDLCPFLTDLAAVDDVRGVLDGTL